MVGPCCKQFQGQRQRPACCCHSPAVRAEPAYAAICVVQNHFRAYFTQHQSHAQQAKLRPTSLTLEPVPTSCFPSQPTCCCRIMLLSGSVRMRYMSAALRPRSSTRIGSRPWQHQKGRRWGGGRDHMRGEVSVARGATGQQGGVGKVTAATHSLLQLAVTTGFLDCKCHASCYVGHGVCVYKSICLPAALLACPRAWSCGRRPSR